MMVVDNKYLKKKVSLTLDLELEKKLEIIKRYPQWKGNRSLVVETALQEFLMKDAPKECKCILCGCTDSHACVGGCSWVVVDRIKGVGVCSACEKKYGKQ